MKRLPILLILILLTGTILFACTGSKTAEGEKTVESALIAIKNADINEMRKYIDEESLDTFGINNDSDDISRLYLREIEYKILSSREDETNVLVTVEITALDMNSVITDFYKEVFANAADSDEEYSRIFKQVIENGNYDKVTNKVDVMVYNTSGGWRIKLDEDFMKALMGVKE